MQELERVTPINAAKELNMSAETLRWAVAEGQIPIGFCKESKGGKRRQFVIYRGLLNQYKASIKGE